MTAYISALLLAAGTSSRMGTPKPLLQWRGEHLVNYQIESLFNGGANEVILVLGHEHQNVIKTITPNNHNRVKITVNSDYKTGKTSSIKSGLKHVAKDSTAIILLAIDQPRSPKTISRVLTGHISINAIITSPKYNGLGGHPLIFSSALKTELNNIDEQTQGIRKVLKLHNPEINSLNIDDPSLRLDFNTPEEYEDAVARDRIFDK